MVDALLELAGFAAALVPAGSGLVTDGFAAGRRRAAGLEAVFAAGFFGAPPLVSSVISKLQSFPSVPPELRQRVRLAVNTLKKKAHILRFSCDRFYPEIQVGRTFILQRPMMWQVRALVE
ncbi:hypothetical protein [Roseibium sp.]|uniref:hypothetical protein n=1 Tax=Roseibium sp. TaxID=1936156 RepID=UPI003D13FB47